MTKTANIIVSTIMWCGIATYVVLAGVYGEKKRTEIVVKNVRITVADTAEIKVVSAKKIAGWIGDSLTGRKATEIDTRAIENRIAQHPEIKHVSVWTDLDSTLNIRVEQRRPMLRVRAKNGYRFWVTDDNFILPDRGEFTAYVPVVTGDIPFPFSVSLSGNYDELRAENRTDFVERFTALENERRNLTADRAKTRSELRQTRASGPKRWWRKARKERFNTEKPKKIAELEAEIRKIDAAIATLAQNKKTLQQKEFFSHQSHLFLSKLANFAKKSLSPSTFWGAEVVQIEVKEGQNRGGSTRIGGAGWSSGEQNEGSNGFSARWQEPEIELVTRTGDHVVKLGELDGSETERLENLRLFYLDGLRHEGWYEFRTVDVRYKNQIVCTK